MPKRHRIEEHIADIEGMDHLPVFKFRKIHDHVGDQLRKIRRKSESDLWNNQADKNSNDKNPNKTVDKGLEGNAFQTCHDVLEQICMFKSKTVEQHANFFMNYEAHLGESEDTEHPAPSDGRTPTVEINVKNEPEFPVKCNPLVFGKGCSMYNPIVIFDGEPVDVEQDGVEVTEAEEQSIEIINLDETVENAEENNAGFKFNDNDKQTVKHMCPEISRKGIKAYSSVDISNTDWIKPGQNSVEKKQPPPILSVTVTSGRRKIVSFTPCHVKHVSCESKRNSKNCKRSNKEQSKAIHKNELLKQEGLSVGKELSIEKQSSVKDTRKSFSVRKGVMASKIKSSRRSNHREQMQKKTDKRSHGCFKTSCKRNEKPISDKEDTEGRQSDFSVGRENSVGKGYTRDRRRGNLIQADTHTRITYNEYNKHYYSRNRDRVDSKQTPKRYYNEFCSLSYNDQARYRHSNGLKEKSLTRFSMDIPWYPIKCSICHSRFRFRQDLFIHLNKYEHCPFDGKNRGNVVSYLCSYCPFESKVLWRLLHHYYKRHGYYFRKYGVESVMIQAWIKC